MVGEKKSWRLVTAAVVTFCLFIGWALTPVLSELVGVYRAAPSP